MDQQEVKLSPAESPAVAPGIFIQVQTRKWRGNRVASYVFLSQEGKVTLHKPGERIKQGHRDQRNR